MCSLAKSGKVMLGSRAMSSLRSKNFLSISQLTNAELEGLIDHSIAIKKSFKSSASAARALRPLLGYSMSMIFQKRSTRTRVSTETGMFLLGFTLSIVYLKDDTVNCKTK